jgi:hypothetical protein
VVEAKVGAAERRAYTQHKRNIARKITQIERVWLVEVKSWEGAKDAEG